MEIDPEERKQMLIPSRWDAFSLVAARRALELVSEDSTLPNETILTAALYATIGATKMVTLPGAPLWNRARVLCEAVLNREVSPDDLEAAMSANEIASNVRNLEMNLSGVIKEDVANGVNKTIAQLEGRAARSQPVIDEMNAAKEKGYKKKVEKLEEDMSKDLASAIELRNTLSVFQSILPDTMPPEQEPGKEDEPPESEGFSEEDGDGKEEVPDLQPQRPASSRAEHRAAMLQMAVNKRSEEDVHLHVTEEMISDLAGFCVANISTLTETVELGLFQGFNRRIVQDQSFKLLSHQAIFVIATLTALRGPAKVATDPTIGQIMVRSVELGSDTPIQQLYSRNILHQEKSRNVRLSQRDLTAGRICSAFPEVAAYGLRALENRNLLPKRVISNALPAWMQFTQAASLPMQEGWRALHYQFSKAFSLKINRGKEMPFNRDIYASQSQNLVDMDTQIGRALLMIPGNQLAPAASQDFDVGKFIKEDEDREAEEAAKKAEEKK